MPRWAFRLHFLTTTKIRSFQFIFLFFALNGQHFGHTTVIGTKKLFCMSCIRVESDTTMLDQFRVRQSLPLPICEMEPVECEQHQDTCVTISMQITHRQFWIGSGCDQRVNYDFPSGEKDGCVEMPAIYRNFHPGFMEERRTLQRVCLCSGNLCNGSASNFGLNCCKIFPMLLAIISALTLPRFLIEG